MATNNTFNRDLIIALLSAFNILLFLCYAEIGHAKLSEDQKARNNPANYVSVEFNKAPLEDLLFFVAEMTGQAFVLNAKEQTLSWVQKDIYKPDLVAEFVNVVTSSGLTTLRSGSAGQAIVITDNHDGADQNPSIQKVEGGNKIYLSEISDHTGRYIVFLGIIYRFEDFPFPVSESPLGPMALVPQDVYLADQQYKMQRVSMHEITPVPEQETPIN